MSAEVILFWIFAVSIVVSAAFVISAKNPVHSAMALVAGFFFLAGVYVLLWAHTIAVLQVLVYAGAIMVLFLFVIMLLSLGDAQLEEGKITLGRVVGGLAAAALLFVLMVAIARAQLPEAAFDAARQGTFGTLARVGQVVYAQYLLPFEAVSLLLLVAIVGAVVVAKSRI